MARKKHTSDFSFAFADRLRICRERSGWQQADAGRVVGISGNNFSNWETRESMPTLVMLQKVCSKTGWSADFLLGLDSYASLTLDEHRCLDLYRSLPPELQQIIQNHLAELNGLPFGD